jgi:hypothetical protein
LDSPGPGIIAVRGNVDLDSRSQRHAGQQEECDTGQGNARERWQAFHVRKQNLLKQELSSDSRHKPIASL